jgi:hypothetical protein
LLAEGIDLGDEAIDAADEIEIGSEGRRLW